MMDRFRSSAKDPLAEMQRQINDLRRNQRNLLNRVLGSKNFVSATPPTSPKDQSVWIYDGGSFYWYFLYDAGQTTYKWMFIGGPPAVSYVPNDDASISATYGTIATAGPSITLPNAGDYLVEIGCSIYSSSGTGSRYFYSYDIGGTGAVDGDACSAQPATVADIFGVTKSQIKTGLGAVTLTAKYKGASLKTAHFLDRWMKVTPVRVT